MSKDNITLILGFYLAYLIWFICEIAVDKICFLKTKCMKIDFLKIIFLLWWNEMPFYNFTINNFLSLKLDIFPP